jgi:hypothetical protein
MRTLGVMAEIRKQDGQMAMTPAQVSPPSPPAEVMGGPVPAEMDSMARSGKVYPSSKEALADFEIRLTDLATDITAHVGTIGQTRYTEGLDGATVLEHEASLRKLRDGIEQLRMMCEMIRMKDAGMVQHNPAMEGGMPGMASLMNMPAPGPAGMPPGGMPMPGPMMGGM